MKQGLLHHMWGMQIAYCSRFFPPFYRYRIHIFLFSNFLHIAYCSDSFRHRKQIRIQLPFSCRFFTATEYILFYFLIHLLSNVKDICNISKTYCITGGGCTSHIASMLQMLPVTEYKSEYTCLFPADSLPPQNTYFSIF